MIAKVRIAPVEQWCEAPKTCGDSRVLACAGLEVEIDTATMRNDPYNGDYCDGRYWTLTEKSAAMLAGFIDNHPLGSSTICEHMLTMD